MKVKSLALILNVHLRTFSHHATDGDHKVVLTGLESPGVLDADFHVFEEVFNQLQVFMGHIAGEISSDPVLVRKVNLCVRTAIGEYLLLYLRIQLVKCIFDVVFCFVNPWMRVQDCSEVLGAEVRDKFAVSKVVVVAQVAKKASSVSNEVLPRLL